MKQLVPALFTAGAIMALTGAAVFITGWIYAPYIYTVGAGLFRIGTSEHARQRKRQNTKTPTRSADIRSIGADPDRSLYVYHTRQ